MTPIASPPQRTIVGPLQSQEVDGVPAWLGLWSRLGLAIVVIWLAMRRPFWQHVFMALSAMAFAALLLPEELMFVARHPVLVFAVPFAAGFAGTNLGRSGIRTLAAWIILGVLAVTIYKSLDTDPATNLWLQSMARVSVETSTTTASTPESR